jgi:uncharacterized protein YkwD
VIGPQIQEFLHFLSLPFAGLNFVDIAIIVVIIIYAFEGYALGIVRSTLDFITFVISFIFGIAFYDFFGGFLVNNLGLPKGFGNALGFFIAAFLCEVILTFLLRRFVMPFVVNKTSGFSSERGEKFLGIIPGVFSAIILLAFVLTMIVALPLSPFLKNSVAESRLGSPLVSNISGIDKKINNIFGGAVNDALTFLTVEPKSQELLKLNFSTSNVKVDPDAERQMLSDVNAKRKAAGVSELTVDQGLTTVARTHCTDMFRRGYFSHYTPEGKSPFDRMAEADIQFQSAGENLALAPDEGLAMQGLMNSPGHRANILSNKFGKVGIGVIDSGIYGEMFCQEFTN